MITDIAPADILAVRTDGWAGKLIRFGERIGGTDDRDNHIVVVHHRLPNGIWRGIAAQPGGVAWADCTPYLGNRFTVTNRHQQKSPLQRKIVCDVMVKMLSTDYDWRGIDEDALKDLHIPLLWGEQWNGLTPDHVVCSSVAAYAYQKAHLNAPLPKDGPHVQPGDWTKWSLANHYN